MGSELSISELSRLNRRPAIAVWLVFGLFPACFRPVSGLSIELPVELPAS